MLNKILRTLMGSKQSRDIKEITPLLQKINQSEAWAMTLDESEFSEQSRKFRRQLAEGAGDALVLPLAYALVREAARRTLGERLFDTQIIGAIALHQGRIIEMKTGEGKTAAGAPAAYYNVLAGRKVHVVTVNDYLAGRDADWMRPLYSYLGLTVASLTSGLDQEQRRQVYEADIVYATNNELGFDFLRDNMSQSLEINNRVQKGHQFCIIDEIDSILIDEARTPLIISGAVAGDTSRFYKVDTLTRKLRECDKDPEGDYPEEAAGDYKLNQKNRRVTFTKQGLLSIEKLLQQSGTVEGTLYDADNFEFVHLFTQSLKARFLYHRDTDYVVQNGKVEIVDEFTGRVLHGRRYSEGLHQAIEAKEKITVARSNRTLASITFQNYFRMYEKISGMTGTADTEAREFSAIYGLDVVVIPTNRPLLRDDRNDVVYFNEQIKFDAICDEIERLHDKGQPVLVGTVSIEKSEQLSKLLQRRKIKHEVLNAKNHAREAEIIAEAGAKGAVTIATNMAGRGTDIKLGGNPEFRARKRMSKDDPERYRQVLDEERRRWQTDYQDIKERGGLYILGTERHESRRIDNQLRGRSGRQGDPGESRFFVSLDDVLMRHFARDSIRNLMSRIGMADGEPIHHPLINNSIERAQKKVEEHNYEIRKHLLEYGDVINKQRSTIYQQRNNILRDDNLKERYLTIAREVINDEFWQPFSAGSRDQTAGEELAQELFNRLLIQSPFPAAMNPQNCEQQVFIDYVMTQINSGIEEKWRILGDDIFNKFLKQEYLRLIDISWYDHLEALNSLREAVGLRSYAQKNPLLEFKLEAFNYFDQLIASVRTTFVERIARVRIQTRENVDSRRQIGLNIAASDHRSLGQFGQQPAQGADAPPQPNQSQTVRRSARKVGRNDPCPCGSGKKYKKCHGANL